MPDSGLDNDAVRATFSDRHILAMTAWGEARNEGDDGMQAVLNVIMNRACRPRWWGRDPVDVCLKPWQFSCWNKGDPNRPKMLTVTTHDARFRSALGMAEAALQGRLPDLTQGADHYHANYVSPNWSKGKAHTVVIKRHIFYRLEA